MRGKDVRGDRALREAEKVIRVPDWLPQVGWQITKAVSRRRGVGYVRFVSRIKNAPMKRGTRAHRHVVERLILANLAALFGLLDPQSEHRRRILEDMLMDGRLHPDLVVHHCDADKLHCMPHNLVAMASNMNPSGPRRNPFTGERISIAAFRAITGG